MEDLRRAARECLQRTEESHALQDSLLGDITIPDALEPLWQDIISKGTTNNQETCESLLVAQGYLKVWGSRELSNEDENAANSLYDWASSATLPSPVFAEAFDLEESSDAEKEKEVKDSRLRSILAVSALASLAALLPIRKASNTPDIVIALASFTYEKDPWTTQKSLELSNQLLEEFSKETKDDELWTFVERILKERVRPLFSKTKNPAITAAGRKNFHPVPLPRFDPSILNPESKPWKIHDVYATTVFGWVISQYRSTDRQHLETHFPLLVPVILTLIDDESLAFKARGCSILSQFLTPIRESKSDILRRTNLSSVFEDAIRPCLLSLPTITPEDESIQLLQVAYPALLSLLKTSYQTSTQENVKKSSTTDREAFISGVTKILRDNLIPSFHHISSTNPTATSSYASFPHPRLSTLLVDEICIILGELGIHTTKYLQEIIPPIYSTLSNPFGTAYTPLLLSAVSATRAVILNAHPRLWRWRGEILGGLCTCWLQILDEESEIAKRATRGRSSESDQSTGEAMVRLKTELKGAVYLLKFALQNPVQAEDDPGQLDAQENIKKELQELVNADDTLGDLLLADIDPNDPGYFGVGS